MEGIIKNSFQIVVVALFPELDMEQKYDERWSVTFNANPEHTINFMIHGCTEYPTILVGNNNEVHFANSHPNCQQGSMVKLWNKTRHSINFELIVPKESENILEIPNKCGFLAGHECTYVLWLWTARGCGLQVVNLILKCVSVCYTKSEGGAPVEIRLTARGSTLQSEICVSCKN